jgi:hypothetical protein
MLTGRKSDLNESLDFQMKPKNTMFSKTRNPEEEPSWMQ